MKFTYALLLLLSTINGRAQDYKRTWNWYFSDNVGMSFATNPPTIALTSSIGKTEGCATISDINGQLLFYTNGVNVWSSNNQLMQNGTGLKGHISSTQSCIIIPSPEKDSIYYIFTTDAVADVNGLQYSIVDLSKNGGLGEVIVKNIPLKTPVCEKLASVRHGNGKDFWILVHGFGDDLFYAYLVNSKGVTPCPVISKIGSVHNDNIVTNAIGAMKFSKDARKLAVTVYDINNSKIDLFDFDVNQGKVTNYLPISNVLLPYGIEFSDNCNHIYVSTRTNELVTFNISKLSVTDIESSKVVLADYQNAPSITGSLQLSANSKIYLALSDSFFLGIINFPDSGGESCNYKINGLNLLGKKGGLGLPNFISSYFNRPRLDFSYAFSCGSRLISLKGKSESPPVYWQWAIQKTPGGTPVQLNGQQSSYTFPDSGWYHIKLKTDADSLEKLVYVEEKLLPLQEQNVCGLDSVLLSAAPAYRCPVWNDSISTYNLWVKSSGIYKVQAYTAQGCLHSDSLRVRFVPLPSKPVITQQGDSLLASVAKTYQWYFNGSPLPAATASAWNAQQNGFYQVLISDSNGCQALSDSFEMSNVGINPSPQAAALPHIYPNPSRGVFTLFSPQATPSVQLIEILDLAGKSIWQQPVTQSKQELNCSFLEPGLYLIKLYTHTKKAYYQKILIQ